MQHLTKHDTPWGPHWALDGRALHQGFRLGQLLAQPVSRMPEFLRSMATPHAGGGEPLAPLDDNTEVWAAGVTYLRSREAREAESTVRDVYSKAGVVPPDDFSLAPGDVVRITIGGLVLENTVAS